MFAPLLNDTFLRACLREPTSHTPVWLMRQAGRYLPEYCATRAKAGSFMGLATNVDFATEVTLQPLERYPLDAAILFSDILTVPDAMGLGLSFAQGEAHDRQVAEQDGGIHAEAAQRLQRDLGGALGREAEREEVPGLGPQRAVFRQVAPGLAHQPHWRRPHRFPAQHPQHLLRHAAHPVRSRPTFYQKRILMTWGMTGMGVGYLGYPSHAHAGGRMSTCGHVAKCLFPREKAAVSPIRRRSGRGHAAVIAGGAVIPAIGGRGARRGWRGTISPLSSGLCRTA